MDKISNRAVVFAEMFQYFRFNVCDGHSDQRPTADCYKQ